MLMKRRCIFSLLLLLTATTGFSQMGTLQLVSGAACSGIVETPILASQLQGIASMSVKINYDTNQVTFLGTRSIHPAIASGILTATNSRFVIAWFSLQPIQITSDTLVVLRWSARNQTGSSTLQFDTQTPGNCEMANVQGQVVPIQYLSGSVAITGAQAPLPLNPTNLQGLNQTSYLFLYNRRPCQQAVVLQLASDSLFNNLTLQAAMPDTTYLYFFSGIQPAMGDSIRYWRMGGVFSNDTSWSAVGKMSFALSLGQLEMTGREPGRFYPNPVKNEFYVSHPSFENGSEVKIKLFSIDGRLLEEHRLLPTNKQLLVEIKNTNYHGQMLINWQNSVEMGLLLANKVGY